MSNGIWGAAWDDGDGGWWGSIGNFLNNFWSFWGSLTGKDDPYGQPPYPGPYPYPGPGPSINLSGYMPLIMIGGAFLLLIVVLRR